MRRCRALSCLGLASLFLLPMRTPHSMILSRGALPAADGAEILRAIRVGPFVGVELDVGGVKEIGVTRPDTTAIAE